MAVNISKRLLVFYLLFIIISLSACGGMTRSDKPAVTSWWLTPYTGMAQMASPGLVSSVSVTVIVVPGLDTDQILTLSRDSELKPYAGARWVDNLPELATSLVSRTLEASGRFDVAPGQVRSGSENCDLQLKVRKFFAQLDSSGQTISVQAAIDGRYQCDTGEPVVLQLNSSIPVHDGRMKLIVAAFQQAMDSTMKDMLSQLP